MKDMINPVTGRPVITTPYITPVPLFYRKGLAKMHAYNRKCTTQLPFVRIALWPWSTCWIDERYARNTLNE